MRFSGRAPPSGAYLYSLLHKYLCCNCVCVCVCGCCPSITGAAGPIPQAAHYAEFCRSVPGRYQPPQSQSRAAGPVHTEHAVSANTGLAGSPALTVHGRSDSSISLLLSVFCSVWATKQQDFTTVTHTHTHTLEHQLPSLSILTCRLVIWKR